MSHLPPPVRIATVEMFDESAGTAVNCDKIGHCYHPATAVGAYCCCRCGQYVSNSWVDTWYPSTVLSKDEVHNWEPHLKT